MSANTKHGLFEAVSGIILVVGLGLLWLAQLSGIRMPGPATTAPPAPADAAVEVHGDIRIEPPGPHDKPEIKVEDAIAEARNSMPGPASEAEHISARFALVNHVPCWIVTYQGVIVREWGPPNAQRGTGTTELNVVIDATTGEYIMAYSFR